MTITKKKKKHKTTPRMIGETLNPKSSTLKEGTARIHVDFQVHRFGFRLYPGSRVSGFRV